MNNICIFFRGYKFFEKSICTLRRGAEKALPRAKMCFSEQQIECSMSSQLYLMTQTDERLRSAMVAFSEFEIRIYYDSHRFVK